MSRPTTRLLLAAVLLAVPTSLMASTPEAPVSNPKRSERADVPDKPRRPDTPEGAYMARLDAVVDPLVSWPRDSGALTGLEAALTAAREADLSVFAPLRDKLTDPSARKLADWYRLRNGRGTAGEYKRFLDENPGWPSRDTLVQNLERAIYSEGGSPAAVTRAFAGREAETGAGLAALATAALASGEEAKARTLAIKVWREHDLPQSLEDDFLQRFAGLLTPADHKWRLDRLLVDDIRWRSPRNVRAAKVRRLLPLLSKAEQAKANARLAVFLGAKNARQLVDALPSDAKEKNDPDWGLAFHRVKLLRRARRLDEAWKLLLSAPLDGDKIVNPDAWWEERRANAYAALQFKKPKMAYELVRNAGALSPNPLKEQAFLAGWLALRYLDSPKTALVHFNVMAGSADGPLSRAKSNYWLGRTHDALSDRAKADHHYRLSAAQPDTFHGQLSLQRLSPGKQIMPLEAPIPPTPQEALSFTRNEVARAAALAHAADMGWRITRAFLYALRPLAKSEAELALTAHLAEAFGDTQMAVRVGKYGVARGHNLYYHSYPVHPFPDYEPLRPPPEKAVLLAIARQESEFNTVIVSGAGARGLLQVMPITARHVCKDYKIKCQIDRLLSDKPYNAKLASAYVGDRMDDFSGSYVLTLAGYNAGPGRARQWIRQFGDPRHANVDPIDWIERIPFEETRKYVAKVLSNVQVYRARLGEGDKALRLTQDLDRARTGKRLSQPAARRSADGG